MSEDTFYCGGCDSRPLIEHKRKNRRGVICKYCKAKTKKPTPPKVAGGPLTQEGSAEFSSDFVPYRIQL